MKVKHVSENHVAYYCPGCKRMQVLRISRHWWRWNGEQEKATFEPSIKSWCEGYNCHSTIANGQIRFLNDCTHELKNQTVPLPDIPVEQEQ